MKMKNYPKDQIWLLVRVLSGTNRKFISNQAFNSNTFNEINPNYNIQSRYYSILNIRNPSILLKNPVVLGSTRQIGMLVTNVIRSVLKLRYLMIGGALTGGSALAKTYDDWKKSLPDTKFIENFFPSKENIGTAASFLMSSAEKIKGSIPEFDQKFIDGGKSINGIKNWVNTRLEDAFKAAEEESTKIILGDDIMPDSQNVVFLKSNKSSGSEQEQSEESQKLRDHMMEVELKYQKQIENLERQNQNLRSRLLLQTNESAPKKYIRKSLIEMYSEVLDELCDFDSTYNTLDNLPRVVVVGDQSSGKTSVLEMVAQARIFPRGAGEMMTRAPVMVTLSEGPYHVAQFKGSSREFDLTKESDLTDLREEVKLRMVNSVRKGKTVSHEVISMTVKGPGLQRMVLVDLPGIISTVTTGMALDTRESIKAIAQQYMSNPNAIILCIQDGAVDAERSTVTELVSQMDPTGKRTIFVLTKVDLAEKNLLSQDRIVKILSGKLFPMKALGYFAVVTGKGNNNDSIESIRDYEESFFRNSKLFRDGTIGDHHCNTRKLSFAVSDRFWKMVKSSVEQQADFFKAARFNLETEWKINFPRIRQLDRTELFEKARSEILDEVVNLSQISAEHWEDAIFNKLWDGLNDYFFENIYLPAAQSGDRGMFKTTVTIQLKQWVDQLLPLKCVEVGWQTLKEHLTQFIKAEKDSKRHDGVYDDLKEAAVHETISRHVWEAKATDVLKVIQVKALEDESVRDKFHWNAACDFMEDCVKSKQSLNDSVFKELMGPGNIEQWIYWRIQTNEQAKARAVNTELLKFIGSQSNHKSTLSNEEITTARQNLATDGVDVDEESIKNIWHIVYRQQFLQKLLFKTYECKKHYYTYRQGLLADLDMDCDSIVLFWQMQQMMKETSNALRQQIVNKEVRRLDKEIVKVLDDFSLDSEKKRQLLTGRRVQLAEELKKIRFIEEKLEEFIQALNKEK